MAAEQCFRDLNLHLSSSSYAFTSPSSPSSPTLVIERPTGDLTLSDHVPPGARRVSNVAGILGMIRLRLDKYLIVVTKADLVGRLKGHMIYKVVATAFLQLHDRPLRDPDEDVYLSILKALLHSGPMYFSYTMDLTNSFQRQAQSEKGQPLWKRADERFFWNRFIQTDLVDFRLGGGLGSASRQRGSPQRDVDPYILPVIYGMLRITHTAVKGAPFTYALVTRRSRHRGGTRYFSRGIDEHGHVSNYNETEQIVVINESSHGMGGFAGDVDSSTGHLAEKNGGETQVLSFVQTRGSVPVYWAEVNNLQYSPKLQIHSIESALAAAREHFAEQIRIYGDNYLVNLVNQRGREEPVKSAYEQVVRRLVSSPEESQQSDEATNEKIHVIEAHGRYQPFDRLHYIYFDFHNETKGLRWHRAQLLLDQLNDPLIKQQYFRGMDMPGNISGRTEIRNLQTSVVRSNCMDCLDRTNLVQSMLARWVLDRMLTDLGILAHGQSTADDPAFTILFRNVWADNADVVSKSYSGTGALKTDFTRTGQRTTMGGFKDFSSSMRRYFQNNFADGPKQDGFDLFLGAFLPSSSTSTSTASGSGSGSSTNTRLFVDRRPIFIQSVPYLLAASVGMVLVAMVTRRLPDTSILPAGLFLRVFAIVWTVIGVFCFRFIRSHGTLYVNWPKLNQPPWAVEEYNAAMVKLQNDKLLGRLVGHHDRTGSNVRLGHLEEGKKRIE
ncbi:MAG: hypothetical protein M1826_000009 [Phylliscum demangeonii]|nr:MAG: hypothetical protein M1826_000009 [Phylliscum demangeonii]